MRLIFFDNDDFFFFVSFFELINENKIFVIEITYNKRSFLRFKILAIKSTKWSC